MARREAEDEQDEAEDLPQDGNWAGMKQAGHQVRESVQKARSRLEQLQVSRRGGGVRVFQGVQTWLREHRAMDACVCREDWGGRIGQATQAAQREAAQVQAEQAERELRRERKTDMAQVCTLPPSPPYSDAKVANRNAKVWHGSTENGR